MKKSVITLSLLSVLAISSLGAFAAPPPSHGHSMHQGPAVHHTQMRHERNYRPAPPPAHVDVHYRNDNYYRHSNTGSMVTGGILGGILGLIIGVNL